MQVDSAVQYLDFTSGEFSGKHRAVTVRFGCSTVAFAISSGPPQHGLQLPIEPPAANCVHTSRLRLDNWVPMRELNKAYHPAFEQCPEIDSKLRQKVSEYLRSLKRSYDFGFIYEHPEHGCVVSLSELRPNQLLVLSVHYTDHWYFGDVRTVNPTCLAEVGFMPDLLPQLEQHLCDIGLRFKCTK